MRHFLIYNYRIAGITDSCDNKPNGFECVDYEGDTPIEELRYNPVTQRVEPIPAMPTEPGMWVWDGYDWVDTTPPTPPENVITLPQGTVKPEEILSHPLTVQAFEMAKTDPHLLALMVEMLAGWILNPAHAETVLPKVLERMGLSVEDNVITLPPIAGVTK